MSCFPGQMKLYKEISIDRFDGINLDASAYFLSHCHADHMVGLESERLEKKFLSNPETKLHVSEITKHLLIEDNRYQHLEPYLCALPIEGAKLVSFSSSDGIKNVVVTLLSAGHCPGSVMFLFEGSEGTALYTGDFRLPKGSAARMTALHTGLKSVKKIDHIHIDTTFCIPDAYYIPNRESCLKALISLVDEWINKGSNYIVRLNLSAKYGYEYLFEALYRRFNKRIYSSRAKHYHCLPHVAKALTDDPTHAQIYACYKTEKVKEKDWSQWHADDLQVTKEKNRLKFLYVTLSTLYFTQAAKPEDVKIQISENQYRLCFSFHSSLSEVCDFLKYLKPDSIHANVIPRSTETLQSVESRLWNLCFGKEISNHENITYKPFGKLKHENTSPERNVEPSCNKRKLLIIDSDSDEEISCFSRKMKK